MKIKVWWVNETENYSCEKLIGEFSLKELNDSIENILNTRPSKYWKLKFEWSESDKEKGNE